MAYVSDRLRETVETRANGLCEYCQSAKLIITYMTVDHIRPEAQGGLTTEDNLCLCCIGCNSFKRDFTTGIDPELGVEIPLYNPRSQNWDDHFKWSEDSSVILPRTTTGEVTIQRLRMNRPDIIRSRQLWVSAGWHPPRR